MSYEFCMKRGKHWDFHVKSASDRAEEVIDGLFQTEQVPWIQPSGG